MIYHTVLQPEANPVISCLILQVYNGSSLPASAKILTRRCGDASSTIHFIWNLSMTVYVSVLSIAGFFLLKTCESYSY